MQLLEADLTWNGEELVPGLRVEVSRDGRIARVGDAREVPGTPRRLAGRALLPGLVDAHSHAFQRGLRGRGERFPDGAGSFWTWREAMYELVGAMDAARLFALSLQAFREMLAAGITTVGEFHYLHHDGSGAGWALDDAVLAAAREAGIRIVLLSAYYATGAIGKPLEGAQLRFRARSPEDYWRGFDRLPLAGPTQAAGCVVHSIRAASLVDLALVHAESVRRGLVCHMHVEEQRREMEDCRVAHGRTPMRVLLDELALDERFTAVHCTHTEPEDLRDYLATGANVCVCPLTEANLGDGTCDMTAIRARPDALSLGTDSNARISMVEEMRWAEYAQRLARERRGVVTDERGRVAAALLSAATRGGARSLGVEAGELRPGAWADLVTLDLRAPSLLEVAAEDLLEAWILGGGDDAVAEVCVGGDWVLGR